MLYAFLKYIHVLGAMVILGTGIGIAFFVLMAHLSRDVAYIARTAATVVVADFLFTATAVIVQPLTGYFLARYDQIALTEHWVAASIALYFLTGMFWLPVVWMQIRMRNLARTAFATGQPLPRAYFLLFRTWFMFGIPGFSSVMLIVWLMTVKPSL